MSLPALRIGLRDLAQYDGRRIVINAVVVWPGLGNRAGLHTYTATVLADKWARHGHRLMKHLAKLRRGDIVQTQAFVNQSRDRGRWQVMNTFRAR